MVCHDRATGGRGCDFKQCWDRSCTKNTADWLNSVTVDKSWRKENIYITCWKWNMLTRDHNFGNFLLINFYVDIYAHYFVTNKAALIQPCHCGNISINTYFNFVLSWITLTLCSLPGSCQGYSLYFYAVFPSCHCLFSWLLSILYFPPR